jgi:hypothetical protein
MIFIHVCVKHIPRALVFKLSSNDNLLTTCGQRVFESESERDDMGSVWSIIVRESGHLVSFESMTDKS